MLLELISKIIAYLLSLYIPFIALLSLLYKKPKRSKQKAKNVVFAIVTIASNSVRDALFETIENVRKRFPEYELYVITDEGAELIPELSKFDINLVIVPKNYRCKKAKYKARALQYFVENFVREDMWYVFLDDDSYPLDDNFLYELPEFEKKGYVAGNGILVPRKGRSTIAFLADFMRTTFDKTFYRFTLGILRRPVVLGMHGELLIVKGNVLKEIGFDFDSITEDSRFAIELFKRKYKTFQTTTRVSILSPNSIKDLLRQRSRWIRGVIHDLKEYPFPVKELTIVGTIILFSSLPGYFMMLRNIFLLLLVLFTSLKRYMNPSPIEHISEIREIFYGQITREPIKVLLLDSLFILINPSIISMITILVTYLIGSQKKYRFSALILAPFLVILEMIAPWYSLFFYKGGFTVINKNTHTEEKILNKK